MRELKAAVALGLHGLLQPRDRLVRPPEIDEIDADVVVGIAVIRVQPDRLLALGDGLLGLPQVAE